MRRLPKHREVLALRYEEGLDYAEIAGRLGCSLGTVKSRFHYANQTLRACLKRRLG